MLTTIDQQGSDILEVGFLNNCLRICIVNFKCYFSDISFFY